MQKFLKIFSRYAVILVVLFSLSCRSNEEDPAVNQDTKPNDYNVLVDHLAGMGFDKNSIEFKDGVFTIENDIKMSEQDVRDVVADPKSKNNAHYRGSLVSSSNVTNIKVYFDSSVPAAWKTATKSAIQTWNDVNGTTLAFSEVASSSSANTRVTTTYENANWVASAYLPSRGRAGYLVTINTRYNSLNSGLKLYAIAHEFGHIFGLYHTNVPQGTFITGTPQSESASIMNAYIGSSWQGLSPGDVSAVQIIYPQ